MIQGNPATGSGRSTSRLPSSIGRARPWLTRQRGPELRSWGARSAHAPRWTGILETQRTRRHRRTWRTEAALKWRFQGKRISRRAQNETGAFSIFRRTGATCLCSRRPHPPWPIGQLYLMLLMRRRPIPARSIWRILGAVFAVAPSAQTRCG